MSQFPSLGQSLTFLTSIVNTAIFTRKPFIKFFEKNSAKIMSESNVKEKVSNSIEQVEWYEPPEKGIFVSYFLTCSIHGLQYLGHPKLHICERFLWLGAFVASVAVGTYMISEMWERYQSLPIVTVLNPSELMLKEIPFPAVTICSVNNVKKSKVDEYLRKIEAAEGDVNVSKESLLQAYSALVDLKRICESTKTFSTRFRGNRAKFLAERLGVKIATKIANAKKEKEFLNYSNPTKLLMEGSQTCEDMILLCVWLDQPHNCSHLFHQIATDFGVCCSFNSVPMSLLMKRRLINDTSENPINVQEWKDAELNAGRLIFKEHTMNRTVPRRQLHPGRSSGLSILLDPEIDEYFCANTDSQGFFVGINTALDIPRLRENGIAVGASSEVLIGVRPEITMADDSIKDFTWQRRHCYLSGEMTLAHYLYYTETNCVDECIANETLRECSCVHYYMPRGQAVDVCTSEDFNCTDNVARRITRIGLGEACTDCLPTCTSVGYFPDSTILQMSQDSAERLLHGYPRFNGTSSKHVSIIHVYFTDDSTYPRLRKEQFGMIDLLSNSGGLLGLCMGFSGLSLLELIYFFTVRLLFKFYRKKTYDPKVDCDDSVPDIDSKSPVMDSRVLNIDPLNHPHMHNRKRSIFKRHSSMESMDKTTGDENLFKIIRKSNGAMFPASYQTLYASDFQTPYLNRLS